MATDYQKNQESIVRQSTLKFVGEYCRMIGTPLTLKEIVRITNVSVSENNIKRALFKS